MERIQEAGDHEYRLTPGEFPISDNVRPATYDQFMTLRDTMVYSNKFYGDNSGRSLIIGTKLDGNPTNTIEIWEPNLVSMHMEPDGQATSDIAGNYVETGGHSGFSCEIVKKGRYKIQHKEQFNNISSSITRIHTYVVQHKTDGTTQSRAVFDWERDTAGEIKRLTAYGCIECDLNKGEWLEFKAEDQDGNDITSEMASSSNWWTVEYIDLAYNI